MQSEKSRDAFACAALTGVLSGPLGHKISIKEIALLSYEIADAMIAAKKQTAKDKLGAR